VTLEKTFASMDYGKKEEDFTVDSDYLEMEIAA